MRGEARSPGLLYSTESDPAGRCCGAAPLVDDSKLGGMASPLPGPSEYEYRFAEYESAQADQRSRGDRDSHPPRPTVKKVGDTFVPRCC